MTSQEKYLLEHPERRKASVTRYHLLNREKETSYRETHRKEKQEYDRKNLAARRARDNARYRKEPGFRLEKALRARVLMALKGVGIKSARTVELLGCPVCWLEVHLESLFKPDMTWENYGPVWHVDHIKPCVSFDLSVPGQQRACFHWTNLQPLFADENLRKGDRCF